MSDICTGPMWTCGETDTAISAYDVSSTLTQAVDRTFVLVTGGNSVVINGRSRDYSYTHLEHITQDNFKYVAGDGYTAECFDYDLNIKGTITENYTTIDTTFHYVDLRNDLIVYTESTQTMEFSRVESGGVDNDGQLYGNLVWLATSGSDTPRVPYIMEDVPITITNKIICTGIGVLHEETINSGYWDGIRILMPLFNGGDPRDHNITIDGTTYNPAEVDWYYLPSHYLADGDQLFWWADWHKAVGIHNEIDAEEAVRMADSFTHSGDRTSSNGIYTQDFTGAAAQDANGNVFFSAAFDVQSGKIVVNKLLVDGEETPIPTDVEIDIWYPLAPL